MLYSLSVEINKVLGLQICWYDNLNDMTKAGEGRDVGRTPGRPAGVGSLCRPAVRPWLATPSAERAPAARRVLH